MIEFHLLWNLVIISLIFQITVIKGGINGIFQKRVFARFLPGLWVSLSEFFRNEFLLKSHWISHYEGLGLVFPGAPINGIVWGVWSFVFAGVIFVLLKKYSLLHTTLLAWVFGFMLMWLVTWNMLVLPLSVLWFAIPLSMLESFVAVYIC